MLIEKSYPTSFGEYRPDVTVITETGETIYFEMAFSNKKKIKDYLDMWLELNNIVVEVNIKNLLGLSELPSFKSLFHKGKCFNLKKNDRYYNSVGKYKERICKDGISNEIKERLKSLDWFWAEVFNFRKGVRDIGYMTDLIDGINEKDTEFVEEILNKRSCIQLYRDYLEYKNEKVWEIIKNQVLVKYGEDYLKYIKEPYMEYDRYFGLNSYLEVHHLDERCYYVTNLKHESINEICESVMKTMKENHDYNLISSKIKVYQEKANKINYKIIQCIEQKHLFKNLGYLYDIEYFLHDPDSFPLRNKDFDFNSYQVDFKLKYKDYRIATSETVFIKNDSEIERLIINVEENFQSFIENIDSLQNIEIWDTLIKDIESKFKEFKITIKGSQSLEDEYEIDVDYDSGNFPSHYFPTYSIKNNGLYKDFGHILLASDKDTYKSVLLKDIESELQESFEKECSDCDNAFNLSMGEALFYKRKGFNFPKRCKTCRKIKRQDK